ncbi:MAG: hypothetical protein JW765_03400 [Deltaproteobacteria bacterium]|nr:hypothetical protein [Candidatus Zymogenaceae bacterium]
MKRLFVFILCLFMTSSLVGCSTIATSKVKDFSKDSNGIRVFPLRIYLLVGEKDATIEYWPDYAQAYDIKPVAFLSTNNFTITIEEKGQIKGITSAMDSTAILTTIGNIVTALANAGVFPGRRPEGPGAAPSKITISKPYGLDQGIYRLSDDGIHWDKVVPAK